LSADSRKGAAASRATSRLVDALTKVSRAHPVARKLVVAPTRSVGRELLRRLALEGTGWIGFEVTTPRPLALSLARPVMERTRLSVADAFEIRALVDEAMDAALAAEGGRFGALADGVGFREGVHGAVEALRLADVDAKSLERARLKDAGKRHFLRRVLQRYEQQLVARRRADTADVIRMALEALDGGGARLPPSLDADVVLLVPGLGTRGLAGRLVTALAARGATVLETDAVVGVETPSRLLWNTGGTPGARSFLLAPSEEPAHAPLELFRAASAQAELREVLRRVTERGLRWDQVEIVTPDAAGYGSVLHAEAARLGIPVTFAVGLPVERTRVGRVVRTYLDWIEEGFQADPIRRLLEAGDLRPRGAHARHAPAALARRFRSLRIGWGRQRYRAQIREALAGSDVVRVGRHESPEGAERRRERVRAELEALRSILYPALKATPSVPDHMGEDGARVSPAEIARGLRAFLRRVPTGLGPERAAREDVERVLERVEATQHRRAPFVAAVTVLRRHLDVRVRAEAARGADEASAPWASDGGHLHLADLEHGGYTGRDAVFLVGLDSDRAPGLVGPDPILSDADRRILGQELPTSVELHRERTFKLAALFARLRGEVTLSYSAWDATEARAPGPSPVLLQALRLARGNARLTFADLERALGPVVSSVLRGSSTSLDGDDVWMSELGRGTVLRAGRDVVAAAFPRLGAGVAARAAAEERPGPHRGVLGPRPELLDPRRNPSLVVSASRLEQLGTCPLRYLHSTVLGVRPPDDPELDPERWLDHMRRGSLLHDVYRTTLSEARARSLPTDAPQLEQIALTALGEAIGRMRAEMPVPGEGALLRETAALEADARAFVRMVRQEGAPWVALELSFGLADDEPVTLEGPGGALRLRGAIDRIDEDLSGLRVIDYKTGVARDFGADSGAFHGGRRLQHAIYAHVAERRLGGMVVAAGYHHPTMRGENRAVMFDRLRLAGVGELLGHLLDGVAAGHFVPTDLAGDCLFCDYAAVCRVSPTGFGKVDSPLAAWSEQHMNAGLWPAFAHLKRARTFEG